MINLLSAHLTEKSIRLAETGQYTFIISPRATKQSIVKDMKRLFNVDAIAINTYSISGKVKKRGVTSGRRSDVRKAIVTVQKGQKIAEYSVGQT